MSVGDEALSVCCTASVKHVFLPYSAELQLFSALDTCSSVNAFTPAGTTSRRAAHVADVNVLAQCCATANRMMFSEMLSLGVNTTFLSF